MKTGQRFSFIYIVFILLISMMIGACGEDGGSDKKSSTGPSGEEDNSNSGVIATVIDEKTATIDSDGGSIELDDGISLVFPENAIQSSESITVKKADPADFFETNDTVDRVVVSCEGHDGDFSTPVEVRVPLPSSMTEADSTSLIAGVIDDETGAILVESSRIEMIDGKPYAIVDADHFSYRIFQWTSGEKPPASAGPLEIPYYNQGSSEYCWATCIQMATMAARFDQYAEITDIIGQMGIDEGGISGWRFRFSPTLAAIVRARTGVKPDRYVWDFVNYNLCRDYLWQEIGLDGHPVVLHHGVWSHAVTIVGYDGNTFYIDDPQSTNTSSIGYKTMTWDEIVKDMGFGYSLGTLAIPKDLDSSASKITLNAMNQAFHFVHPKTATNSRSRLYRFSWDHLGEGGRSFVDTSTGDRIDPLPGDITDIVPSGDIELYNSSRTQSKTLSVMLDITCTGTGEGHFSMKEEVTLSPNSMIALNDKSLNLSSLSVDEFRWNATTTNEYILAVTVLDGSRVVDEVSIPFDIASRQVTIDSISPESGSIGDRVTIKGLGFGTVSDNTKVYFNGYEADSSTMSISNTELSVIVPDGATSGQIKVVNCDVDGKGPDFEVEELTHKTLTGSHTIKDTFYGEQLAVSMNVNWKLTGTGLSLDWSDKDEGQYSFSLKHGFPASVSITCSASLSTSSFREDGYGDTYTLYEFGTPKLVTSEEDDVSFYWADGDFSHSSSLSSNSSSANFTFDSEDDYAAVDLYYEIPYTSTYYDEKGEVSSVYTEEFTTRWIVSMSIMPLDYYLKEPAGKQVKKSH